MPVLQNLIKDFYSGNLKFCLQVGSEDVEQLTLDNQQTFLEATVLGKVLKKYPVSNEFSKIFLKKLITLLEISGQEVHDDMYSFLCTSMENKVKEEFSYRHYIISNCVDQLITLRETNKIVVNGTTGMRTWEAALILSDWLLCNKSEVENKNLLELGSGVGFTGITIAKLCDIKSLTMTDCHYDVLNAICHNIEINFADVTRREGSLGTKGTDFIDKQKILRVRALDWFAIEDTQKSLALQPDVIIGTDIVYDPEIIKPLCSVLKSFLDTNKNCQVYIASIIRNENTHTMFLEELCNMQLHWEVVTQTKCVYLNWNTDVGSEDVEQLTLDNQQTFLEATVLGKVLKKYPVSNEFSKIFLKKLITLLEISGQEVHDDMYSFLCTSMENKVKEEFSYRHYIISNCVDQLITLRETNKIVVNGTTGMRTWEAALILSDWLLCNKSEVENKNLLELGSGVGFTGITIAKLCDIKSLTMTDCHYDVLNAICHNIEINFADVTRREGSLGTKGTDLIDKQKILRVRALDWFAIEDTQKSLALQPDVIIGTDIVYDPEIIKPLCSVLKSFLDTNKNCQVYIASIIRNENTHTMFLEELCNMQLHWEVVTQTKCVYLNWNTDVNSCIINIKNMMPSGAVNT